MKLITAAVLLTSLCAYAVWRHVDLERRVMPPQPRDKDDDKIPSARDRLNNLDDPAPSPPPLLTDREAGE